MTDLTKERLDELARTLKYSYGEFQALIAMAKRTEAAESAMEMYACEMSQFADEVKGLERERDEWRAFARGTDVWDYEGLCACCHETDHMPDCLWTIAALAPPTADAGGA